MKRIPVRAALILCCLVAALAAGCGGKKPYPYRWFYLSNLLNSDAAVDSVEKVVKLASDHGLNGMLMFSRFDYISLQDDAWRERLKKVAAICKDNGVELVPRCLDMGYNDETLLHHKADLAEGLPVENALFVVDDGKAALVPDPDTGLENGSFEVYTDDLPEGFTAADSTAPGRTIFIDEAQAAEGKVSLRIEVASALPELSPIISTRLPVTPHRVYRLSGQVRTADIRSGGDVFPFMIQGGNGNRLNYFIPPVPASGEWVRVDLGFNSLDQDSVIISVAAPEGVGVFWVDDLRLEEIGPLNILRRPGTPFTVKSEKDGTLYEEGRDFAPVTDTLRDFRFSHDAPSITLLPGGRIRDGERLRVSWYHGTTIYHHQVVGCMSEPEVYEIWKEQVKIIDDLISPQKYFLSVDELRMAGTCAACRERGLTPGQLVADCARRQVEIVRAVNPQAELFIWSDMFDPNHNADQRGQYYLASGDFYGSWEGLPRDLVIACWYFEKRRASLDHFSALGFRTLACGFYEAKDMEHDKAWLEALDSTVGAMGIMYTTWNGDYSLLAEFGDLVENHPAGKGIR